MEDNYSFLDDQDNNNNNNNNNNINDLDLNLNLDDEIIPGVNDLPLFANNEAKKIHLDLQQKEEKLESISDKISDMKERIRIMSEHFKNVQQEVEHTNGLLNSKKAEVQTENHLRQLTSRSLGRAKLESKELNSEISKVQDFLNQLQNQIYKANEKLDEFKMQMNWNQEDLNQWAIASKQKEEDNLSLQKYTRADEIKIKELNLQIEHLNKEYLEKHIQLENEVTDTQAKQMELDRIANEFRLVHKERQQLVNQWQDTIELMKLRDNEINEISERYSIAKQERIKQENKVTIQKKRLQAQINENNEVNIKINKLIQVISKKREEMIANATKLNNYRNELESLKNELISVSDNIIIKRNDNINKMNQIEEKKINIEKERQKYHKIKLNLQQFKNEIISAEEVVKQIENNLIQTEKKLLSKQNKLKLLNDTQLKELNKINELKQNETLTRTEINGTISMTRNLNYKLLQLDKESARQQELLYNAEFQIQQIERKIARNMGQRSDEEKKVLKETINKLENVLNTNKEKKKILISQVRKITNELISIKLNKDELNEMKVTLSDKINELELSNRMIDDEIKNKIKEKEEIIVLNDILRLEVRRLRGLLSLKADVVCSLENRKEQLKLSLNERKEEISIHKNLLKTELKLLLDEKHTILMDLKQRELNIEKLKSKYEIKSTINSGDEEGGYSQSYYIIKAAQKREELRRKGDELDTEIRKKEREIRALQTTLDHLNARNIAFRSSFQKVDMSGDETEILRKLEERIKLTKENVFKKKKELQRITTDIEEDTKRFEQIQIHISRIQQQREHLNNASLQIDEEIQLQENQLLDYDERILKLNNIHHEKVVNQLGIDQDMIKQQGGTLEEKAAYAEVLKDVVQNVLYTLGQLSNEFPEVTDTLTVRLQEADLKIPLKPAAKLTTSLLNNNNLNSARSMRISTDANDGQ